MSIDPLLVITATVGEGVFLREALGSAAGARGSGDSMPAGTIGATRISVLALGIGKSSTAAGLARAIDELGPAAVIQLGVGGTYAGSFLPVGSVAVAEAEFDLDFGVAYTNGWDGAERLGFGPGSGIGPAPDPGLGSALSSGPDIDPGSGSSPKTAAATANRLETDPELTRWLSLDGRVPVVAFGTSDAVSGDLEIAEARRRRFDLSVESMEGAAAAQTASSAGVPFAELRGISNVAGQRDKVQWELRASLRAATAVLVGALRATR